MFKLPSGGRERSAAVLAGIALALAPAALPVVRPALQPLPAAQAQQSNKPVLRISAIPDQKPEKLNRLYGLVANELSKQLGVPVQYVPVTNYIAKAAANTRAAPAQLKPPACNQRRCCSSKPSCESS